MSARDTILKRLTNSPNLAVERMVELALLAGPDGPAQQRFFDVIASRNMRAGWIALIRAYHLLNDSLRAQLLERRRDLFGPLSEAMQDIEGPTRGNVIDIVRRCDDPRLAYLLAQALIDMRPEIRELGGTSLLAAVQEYRARGAKMAADGDMPEIEDSEELRRSVDYVLRQYKTHKHTAALLAALNFERQQDALIWSYFSDPHDELTKSASALLRTPTAASGPGLAPAIVLALASPLKPAAMAGFSLTEEPGTCAALARESFRLLDPVLRAAAMSVGQCKALTVLWKEAPPAEETWPQWLRLVEAVGFQMVEKVFWLKRLLDKVPPDCAVGVSWKLAVMGALAATGAGEAGRVIAQMMADADLRVARCAARYVVSRSHPEWRQYAGSVSSPHAVVRRMAGLNQNGAARAGVSAMNQRVTAVVGAAGADDGTAPPGFGKVWQEYPEMPPAVQNSTARSASAADPQFAEQMKVKLASTLTLDIAQGLKMISVLPNLKPYRAQIITLCGHADVRVAAAAVKLIGRLEDPKLKDLLEAAARHADPRVRANAIESMSALHIANRSQQVLALLNSRHNRERANAIRAISEFDFATARECLQKMLTDNNPLHRISALWVVEQLGLPALFRQVSAVARRDPNNRVRKRAADMIETLTGNAPTAGKGR